MIEKITSPQNMLMKEAAALKQKKYRDETGLFAVEGVRLAEEAVTAGWDIAACIGKGQTFDQPRVQKIIDVLAGRSVRIVETTDAIYEKIAETDQPQGLTLLVKKREPKLEELKFSDSGFIVILDGVQDPGNVGTVIRTADAAGCSAVLLSRGCADLFSGKTIRATMGSIFHLPVVDRLSTDDIEVYIRQNSVKLCAATLDGAAIYDSADFTGPVAIAFGNEGNGLSSALLNLADERLFIPIYGRAESLNVATSAAVFLYEAARQRRIL